MRALAYRLQLRATRLVHYVAMFGHATESTEVEHSHTTFGHCGGDFDSNIKGNELVTIALSGTVV